MSITELKERLLDDYDVQSELIDNTVEQIQGFGSTLQKEFFDYLEKQELSEACTNLIKEYGLLPIGAFMIRDWLEKNPEEAQMALRY